MPNLNRVTLRDWERTLQAERKSPRTVQSYLESVGQLADHLAGADLLEVDAAALREFMVWLAENRSPSTCSVRYRAMQQFYKWAVGEELIIASPMARMRPPSVPEKPVPVVPVDDLRKLLRACDGKGFLERRDTAIIRLMLEPGGARRAEVAHLRVDDVDLDQDVVVVTGKGSRVRAIPFGYKTGQAITRYLRLRGAHPAAERTDALWLAQRGALTDSGLAQMLERRCDAAGIDRVHPHQLRHTAADLWLAESGGDETSAMRLFGWRSRQMLNRYGASNADARAHAAARKLSIGDRL